MVKLENTTSIYEIAFTINFIVGYLIISYRNIYLKSLKVIFTQSKAEEFTEGDNCYLLNNGSKFSKKAFSRIQYLLTTTIVSSILAILLSFFFLLFAGLNPDSMIPKWIFILSSSIFILFNPILYFIYKINILNLEYVINVENINDSDISSFMKSYIPLPIYHESIFQKLKWFLYFKFKYIKSLFHKKKD